MRHELPRRWKFLGCEVLYREACHLAAVAPRPVDVEFLRKGLHDLPREKMLARLQQAVDAAAEDGRYDAVLLGYARCNDALAGLTARSVPLVIPRAHDCITLFFGGRDRFGQYFETHPGTFFRTTGWSDRDDADVPGEQGVMAQLGLDRSYEQLVEQYGPDNAQYIWETLGGDGVNHYDRLCYIRMGLFDESPWIDAARSEAERRQWTFDLVDGDLGLLGRLFAGQWDQSDFVIVQPGRRLVGRNDGSILDTEP